MRKPFLNSCFSFCSNKEIEQDLSIIYYDDNNYYGALLNCLCVLLLPSFRNIQGFDVLII